MDRCAFLSSLPFLGSVDPPSGGSQPQQPLSRKGETLLADHILSIEPVSTQGESFGAAFFATNQSSSDPAMCSFELSVGAAPPSPSATISPGGSSVSTSLSSSRSPRTPRENRSVVFFTIDNRWTFKVDTRRLKNVEVVEATRKDRQKRPPCLIMSFSTCLFRVFSQKQGVSVLQAAKSRLASVTASGGAHSSWGHSPAAGDKPESIGLSHSLSSDGTAQTFDLAAPRQHTKQLRGEDAVVERATRRRKSLIKIDEGLRSLDTLLGMPAVAVEASRAQPGQLLTAIAKSSGSSYCSSSDLAKAARALEKDVDACHDEIDDALSDLFPRGKQKRVAQDENPGYVNETLSALSAGIMKRKQNIRKRHGLLLLPTKD